MVIAIIAILAAMLLPALSAAKKQGVRTRCASNQAQIGLAYRMYVDDNSDFYPWTPGIASVGGATGTTRGNNPVAGDVAQDDRPLNRYASNPNLFACPGDKGDVLANVEHVFTAFGNSYRVAWWNAFRVKRVVGLRSSPIGSPEATPITGTEVALRPSTKIIQGDWHWHGNRGITDDRSVWHNFKGQARYNMLFGDSHVELVKWPEEFVSWTYTFPPDIDYTWW